MEQFFSELEPILGIIKECEEGGDVMRILNDPVATTNSDASFEMLDSRWKLSR